MQEQKMNICLLNDSFPPTIDGVSNTVFNYASVIHGSLGNVVVGTPQYPGARDECPFPVVRYPSLRIKKITDYRTGVPFDPVSVRAILGYEPDIIHTHCPFASALLARTLRRLGGAPIVFTYHTKFDIDIANIFGTELMRAAAAKFLVSNVEECDEVWVVSRGAGENLKSLGYAGGVTVMKNGVDFPKGRVPRRAIDAVSEKHALPDGVPVFLFVGRMMWYKGIRMILDGLVRVKKRGADFRMVFVGSGG
ncbi:MAG: glycosyltransferase, partial [Oscillospiraceae bacterium]|nr:glycosyltransferase [Oscillospiraceae bacterium]